MNPEKHPRDPFSFALPHGSREQSAIETEQRVTAETFTNVVDNVLLNHLAEVRHYRTMGNETRNFLVLEDATKGLHVEVIDAKAGNEGYAGDQDESWQAAKIISIQSGGQTGDALTYTLYRDGTVRRYDTSLEGIDDGPLIDSFTRDDSIDVDAVEDHFENTSNNIKFERDVGVNGAPVEAREIDSLDTILSSSDLLVTQTYANLIPLDVVQRTR